MEGLLSLFGECIGTHDAWERWHPCRRVSLPMVSPARMPALPGVHREAVSSPALSHCVKIFRHVLTHSASNPVDKCGAEVGSPADYPSPGTQRHRKRFSSQLCKPPIPATSFQSFAHRSRNFTRY